MRDSVVDISFEIPAERRERAFAEWLADWRDDPYDPYPSFFAVAWTDLRRYVELCAAMRRSETASAPVAMETWWAFEAERLVGELHLRSEPTRNGNVGYKVRPSARRRGIATALLRHGLVLLGRRGLREVLITCEDGNVASATVIERCGGVREADSLYVPSGKAMRRYTIATSCA